MSTHNDAIDQEFDDAAKEFAAAQTAFMAHQMRNLPTDPAERQKSEIAYQNAKCRLFEAQARMRRASVAKYPESLMALGEKTNPKGT